MKNCDDRKQAFLSSLLKWYCKCTLNAITSLETDSTNDQRSFRGMYTKF